MTFPLCDFSPPIKTLAEHLLDIAIVLSSYEIIKENPSRLVVRLLILRDYAGAAVTLDVTLLLLCGHKPTLNIFDAC